MVETDRAASAPAAPAGENGESAPAKVTPMMRQYLSVKAEHPTSIVLFRMGDFFETFFDDAADCARLLDITLTARSKEGIPMAGVPHHAVEGYISRLIELGRTVVLVDQVEDPKLAKGLVRREVTDVLSPGTFLDPNAPPRLPTYLVALVIAPASAKKNAGDFGIAALDLSTGEFRATSGSGEEVLTDELGRLGMREVLVSEALRTDDRIARLQTELPKTAFTFIAPEKLESRAARAALEKRFGAEETRALESTFGSGDLALNAAGVALLYVEETQSKISEVRERREPLRHVGELKPYLPGDALVLDLQARAHLELFRAAGDGGRKGSLLGALDEAVTAMGGRMFARWLAYPLRNIGAIAERQDAIEVLIAAPSLLDRIREKLELVADLERLIGRVVMGRATPRDLGVLRNALEAVPPILGGARAASRGSGDPGTSLAFAGDGEVEQPPKSVLLARLASVDPCADTGAAIARALVEEPPIDLDAGDIFRAGYDAELDRLNELAKNGKSLIAAMEADEREKTGIGSLKVRYNRVFGYYIEVTRPNLKLVPKHYIRKQTTANGERFYTEALRDLETEVLESEEKRADRTRKLFSELVEQVAREAKRVARLAESLAAIDVLAAGARIAEKRSWSRPIIDDSGAVEIADGRHPVLELLSTELGERFVPNDIAISPERSLMIITGPNMAGKSTIMRQTALIGILAHMGLFVPASSARIGVLDRIFTRVGASDDLSRGRSTFMVEMTETARILRSATKNSLILLDEIGRGTSTFDGLSIAWAVAEHLHDAIGAKTLFATHYHELTDICRDKPRATNHHVAVKEWNEQIVFLRKLLPGPTNRSYGVQVARLAGLPRTVIDRARAVLASLESQALAAGDGSPVAHLAAQREVRERGNAAGQLFLFGAPPAGGAANEDPAIEELVRALDAISIDDTTPRQALDRLSELKRILSTKKR